MCTGHPSLLEIRDLNDDDDGPVAPPSSKLSNVSSSRCFVLTYSCSRPDGVRITGGPFTCHWLSPTLWDHHILWSASSLSSSSPANADHRSAYIAKKV